MPFVDELPASLKENIIKIAATNEVALGVFEELYNFLTDSTTKKRKISPSTNAAVDDSKDFYEIDSIDPGTIIFQLQDLSFQSPLRKKLNLTLSISPITQKPILSISKSNGDKPELIIDELTKENITFSTFLPIPEKKNMLYFVIFYERNLGNTFQNDPIVLTMNKDQVNKQLVSEKLIKEGDDIELYIQRQAAVSGFKISDTFAVGTTSFFVQAHRGTKEGLLYFLPNHVLFGFKKPVLLFKSQDIDSISYSSITRVTFNVTLLLKDGDKYDFSMIDQSDFANIDGYIKNRQVLDISMTEELKAKPLTKNQESGALAEAEQQLPEEYEEGEIDDDDDEENDANFQVGAEIDDTSDVSDNGESDSDEDDDDDDGDDDERSIDLNSDDD